MRTRPPSRAIAALTGASVVLALGVVPGALAHQTISDPVGDAGSAPDINAVSVSNDSTGTVTLTVTTNEPQLDPNASFFVHLDTDSNATTGLSEAGLGVDYFLIADATGAFLAEVQGNVIFIHLSSSAAAGYSGGIETIRVNRRDLGNTSGFRFRLESDEDDGNGNTLASDSAPDGPPYPEYSLAQSAALSLSLSRPAPAKDKPRAGKLFVVTANVARSDGAAVDSGTVSCKAHIGEKAVRASGLVSSGSARCSMRIPNGTKGKSLRGSLTVSTAGAAPATRSFAYRIG